MVALARMGDARARAQIARDLSSWSRDRRTLAVAAAGELVSPILRPLVLAMQGDHRRAEPTGRRHHAATTRDGTPDFARAHRRRNRFLAMKKPDGPLLSGFVNHDYVLTFSLKSAENTQIDRTL